MKLIEIQQELATLDLSGWLFFDHHQRDPLAYRILEFEAPRTPTRRWFYFVPAFGQPVRLVHRIESRMLDALPGEKVLYSGWQELKTHLRGLLAGRNRVAMQYSPECAIPYVAMVDAGTVDLVRSFGVDVVSSADLVQIFEASWSPASLEKHLEAGRLVDSIRQKAFQFLGERLRNNTPTTELDVKEFVLSSFKQAGLFTDHGPIAAVNQNCSDPHYEPTRDRHQTIKRGDFFLLDLWAKIDNDPDAVYYDITWTGRCYEEPTDEMKRVFSAVSGARDAAVDLVRTATESGRELRGFEVDDAAREHIRSLDFGDYFIHRTGHSIGRDVHGSGANMDNLENHDERKVIPLTCFSVEPGIYLPEFGIRSEVNVFVGEGKAMVTGEIQRNLIVI